MTDQLAVDTHVLVNGAPKDDLVAHLDQVIVDEDLHRPAMFCLTLDDPDRNILQVTGLRAGVEVAISVVGEGATGDGTLVIGDVVSVECDYDDIRHEVVVRGYDATHRLHRGRHTRVFHDVTDSDIFQAVVGEAGLQIGDVAATSEVFENVTQANQTDWEFIMSRARPLGFDISVVDGYLRFGKRGTADDAPPEEGAGQSEDDPRQLVYAHSLVGFHGRISAAEQVGRVEVRGYDETRKEAVLATAQAGTGAAGLALADPGRLAGLFDDSSFVEVVMPVRSEREAGDIATALAERIGSGFAEVDGVAVGNTVYRAGVAVRVTGVNDDFNGAYVLSHVRHVIDHQVYRTHFTVGGHHDRSMLGLMTNVNGNANGNGQSGSAGRVQSSVGLVRGIVSANNDPEMLGRVQIKLPWLHEEFSSAWAPVVQLGAGPSSGTMFLPAVHDEVLVGFEHGNIDRPIVVGGLFNAMDKPPEYAHFLDDGRVTGRSITSRKGHEIAMYDADDNSAMTLMVVSGSGVPVVSIGLNADDNKLVIQSEGDVEVQAEREIKLTGQKITVQAQGDLVLKGGMVKIN